MILGTAGHIDHGKTTLVRALTGVDTDRLPEEKRRGITIELGFAPLRLDGVGTIGVVDVPGHEGFVRTMLAGATGVDLALLVVAADEGVMPQTREHFAILRLLGVTRGVVALTKCDLVDDEWRALVIEDVRALLADSPLADAAVVGTSSVTGAGLAELRAAIADAARAVPSPTSSAEAFSLPTPRGVRRMFCAPKSCCWMMRHRRCARGRPCAFTLALPMSGLASSPTVPWRLVSASSRASYSTSRSCCARAIDSCFARRLPPRPSAAASSSIHSPPAARGLGRRPRTLRLASDSRSPSMRRVRRVSRSRHCRCDWACYRVSSRVSSRRKRSCSSTAGCTRSTYRPRWSNVSLGSSTKRIVHVRWSPASRSRRYVRDSPRQLS